MNAHSSDSTTSLPLWLSGAPFETTLAQRLMRNVPEAMRNAKRWLLHRAKKPFYVSGAPRSGTLDSPEDLEHMGTFEQAIAALQAGRFDGVGFALGDGWQGIDLDKVDTNGLAHLVPDLPGYVERSPSGKGWHAIGRGERIDNMGADGSGVEAYSGRRFFTVTGDEGHGEPVCLAGFVRARIEPLRRRTNSPVVSHSAARVGIAAADWNALSSALSAIPPSCSRDEWVRTGFALKAQGEASGQVERAHEMWRAWSAGDPTKYPGDKAVAQQWDSFQSDKENAVGPASIFHLAQHYGWTRPQLDVSEMFTASAAAPSNEPPPHALSIVFADALPEAFQPPDELIQGLLTVGDCSLWYGDSNAGKTFVLLDAACAVARGVPWMGRQTEPGLVVYLAAESPSSVRSRVQAYQQHHGVRVPHFAIVQDPIDLFDGDTDTDAIVRVVRDLEEQTGQRCRLIIGDTLARLSAGANENAGQDMGLVVRRIDRLRTECRAHVALIHHGGKDQSKGARGWSGIRAAVDTEIEVTDTPAGRCFEVTKQRDLPTKGQRCGFRLQTLTLGQSKWGAPVTSCVVQPTAAPTKQQGKPLPDGALAVVRVMRGHPNGIMKKDLVKSLELEFNRTTVTRSVDRLIDAGTLTSVEGIIYPGNLFPVLQFDRATAVGSAGV